MGKRGGGKHFNCARCNKACYIPASRAKEGKGIFCSIKCTFDGQRKLLSCLICKAEFYRDKNAVDRSPNSRTYCSRKCYAVGRSTIMVGENSPTYIDGKSMKYGSNIWKKARAAAKQRDGHRCKVCGTNKGRLDVHHIKEVEKFKTLKAAHALKNLITVCRRCHARSHHH